MAYGGMNKWTSPRNKSGGIPRVSTRFSPSAGIGLPNPSCEAKFSGAHGDREIFISHVQLTTSRIGSLTLLILTLAMCDDHTYIDSYVF